MRLDGADAAASLPGPQGRALFAFLVLHRFQETSRDELVDAVWPAAAPPAPDQALRALLSKLRRALGAERVAGRSRVRLVLPADAWVDVEAAGEAIHAAESAVAQQAWERAWVSAHVARNVATRPLLPEADAPWLAEPRRRLDDIRLRALEALAAGGLGLGGPELDTAARAARALTEQAPFRERGHLLLMRALAAQGNGAEALLVFEALRRRLRDELGAAPGPELQALHRELLG